MRLKHSKITGAQTNDLLAHFVEGTPARTAAERASLNRNTVRQFYHKLREIIAWKIEQEWQLEGAFKIDESFFGGERRPGPGPDGTWKVALFGIMERDGKFYTRPIRDEGTSTAPPIMRNRIVPDSIVYTEVETDFPRDFWKGDNTVDIMELRHRIYRNRLSSDQRLRISGIAKFWNEAKSHLGKYNGIPWKHFHLFLKEGEWRCNYGPPGQSPDQQVMLLKAWVKKHNQR